MTPLTFNVRAADGRLLDRFTEADLVCVAYGRPEKSWHEASLWAAIAIEKDRRLAGVDHEVDDEDVELFGVVGRDEVADAEVGVAAAVDDRSDGPVGAAEFHRAERDSATGDDLEVRHGAGGYR